MIDGTVTMGVVIAAVVTVCTGGTGVGAVVVVGGAGADAVSRGAAVWAVVVVAGASATSVGAGAGVGLTGAGAGGVGTVGAGACGARGLAVFRVMCGWTCAGRAGAVAREVVCGAETLWAVTGATVWTA